MKFIETELRGAFIVETEKISDDRGFFARIWCKNEYERHGLESNILQSNVGFSVHRGTLRGLHFQLPPYDEVKIIRCTRGKVFDVIVDLRAESPTFKRWVGVELTQDNFRMLYVPKGFAQGYLTMDMNTEIYYHTSQFYAPGHAKGVRYNDSAFKIDWPGDIKVISAADRNWPDFAS